MKPYFTRFAILIIFPVDSQSCKTEKGIDICKINYLHFGMADAITQAEQHERRESS
jgi:hypothetical protein